MDVLFVLADTHEQAKTVQFACLPDYDSGQDLKLIDFGLSKFWRPDKSMEMRATLRMLAARGFKFRSHQCCCSSVRSLAQCQLARVT